MHGQVHGRAVAKASIHVKKVLPSAPECRLVLYSDPKAEAYSRACIAGGTRNQEDSELAWLSFLILVALLLSFFFGTLCLHT